jgi:HK97 family phage prohead protease
MIYMTSAFKSFDARIGFRFIKGKGQDVDSKDFFVEGWATSEAIDFEDDVFDQQAMAAMADGLLRSPTIFYNHDYNIPIGKTVEAEVRETGENGWGVWVKVFISDSAIVPQTGQSIRQLISEGVLSGFSVGGRLIQTALEFSEELGRKIRRIIEFAIYEVSVVGIPCNRTARIMEWYVRSYRQIAENEDKIVDVQNLDEIKRLVAETADFVVKGIKPMADIPLIEEANTREDAENMADDSTYTRVSNDILNRFCADPESVKDEVTADEWNKLITVPVIKALEIGEYDIFEFAHNVWDAAIEASKEDQIFGPINEDYWYPLYLEAVFDGSLVVYNPNNEVMYKASFETTDGENFTFSDAKEVRARVVYEEVKSMRITDIGHPKFERQSTKDASESEVEDTEVEDVEEQPEADAETDVVTDEPEADVEASTEDSEDAESEQDAEVESDVADEPEADVEASVEDDESEVVEDDVANVETDSEDDADADVEDEPDVEAETEVEADTEAEVEADVEASVDEPDDGQADTEVEVEVEPAPESVIEESDEAKATAAPMIEKMALEAVSKVLGLEDADQDELKRALSAIKFVQTPVIKAIDFDPEMATQHLRRFCSEDGSGDKEKTDWRKYAGVHAKVAGGTKQYASYSMPMFEVVDGDLTVVPKAVDEIVAMHKAGDLELTEMDKRRVQTAHKMYAHGDPFDMTAEEEARAQVKSRVDDMESVVKTLGDAVDSTKEVMSAFDDLKKAHADEIETRDKQVKSLMDVTEEMAKRLELLENANGISQQVAAGEGEEPKTASGLMSHMKSTHFNKFRDNK